MSAVTHELISAFIKDATLISSPQGREDLSNYRDNRRLTRLQIKLCYLTGDLTLVSAVELNHEHTASRLIIFDPNLTIISINELIDQIQTKTRCGVV
jgi:hypothetical protein